MSGILTRKGINAQRKLLSNDTSIDDEINDIRSSNTSPNLYRAVVQDILSNVSLLNEEEKKQVKEKVLNPNALSVAPRNSIIATIISNAESRRTSSSYIIFPFFSHIQLPLKPGEHVWIMFPDDGMNSQGMWLTRVVDHIDIDDPNYTHSDRKFDDPRELTNTEKALQINVSDEKPGFPNGGNTEESLTLADPNGYEKINSESITGDSIVYEPVPQHTKRPSEFTLQGSNNTLISFRDDRDSLAFKREGKKLKNPDKKKFSGTIDIVVGRGFPLSKDGEEPRDSTSPKILTNTRNNQEADRTFNNEREGDPNYTNDLGRIMASMNVEGHKKFNLNPDKLPEKHDGSKLSENSGPFNVLKSEHTVVISKKEGTVRIVKEGDRDKTLAIIAIDKDGSMVIDSPHIVIGSKNLDKNNGEGDHVFIGQGASESMVLGDTLKSLLEEYSSGIQNSLNEYAKALNEYLQEQNAQSFGNFGIPLPALGPPGSPSAPPMKFSLKGVETFKKNVNDTTKKFQDNLDTMLSRIGKTR